MNLPQKIWVQNQPTSKCMCAAAPEVPVCICKLTQVLTKELHTSPFMKEKNTTSKEIFQLLRLSVNPCFVICVHEINDY